MPTRLLRRKCDDILVTIKVTDVDEAPGIADGAADPGLAELIVDEADSSDKDYYVRTSATWRSIPTTTAKLSAYS